MKTRLIVALAGALVVLGVVFFLTRPSAEEQELPPPKAWSFQFLELDSVTIGLPRRGLTESWVKGADKQWYFDGPDGVEVDRERWGGGVPVILAGPRASRALVSDATDEQLAVYGLVEPQMRIDLTTEGGEAVAVEVGDVTPTGEAYYFRLAGEDDVFTIDHTWFEVLERLVTVPPYPPGIQ